MVKKLLKLGLPLAVATAMFLPFWPQPAAQANLGSVWDLKVDASTTNLALGGSGNVNAYLKGYRVTDAYNCTFSAGDPSILYVNNGFFSAIAPGSSAVIASYYDPDDDRVHMGSVTIYVSGNPSPPTPAPGPLPGPSGLGDLWDLSVIATKTACKPGFSGWLNAYDADDYRITDVYGCDFSTPDSNIVFVDGSSYRALRRGTAVITCRYYDPDDERYHVGSITIYVN